MRFSLRFGRPGIAAVLGLAFAVCTFFASRAEAGTLEDVRKRGHIECGVTDGTPGLSTADSKGMWSGLGVDFCHALAAAVLGSADAVKFTGLAQADRVKSLKAGAVDVLAATTPWTLSLDTDFGIRFAGVLFYDGQGFMARRSDVVSSVYELSGGSVCVTSGTSDAKALEDFFVPRQMKYQAVVAERWADAVKAYAGTGCTVLTGNLSTLAHERSMLAKPGDHILLPEIVSKDPTGPAVRLGDDQWFSIVRWTLMALLSAEEFGVTRDNADSMKDSQNLDVKRLLGIDGTLGASLGLTPDWAFQAVKQAGGYGEMFERNLGTKSNMKLDRGLNELWTKGGLMYAAPLR